MPRQDLFNQAGENADRAAEFRNRFLVEACAQARVHHPNVCSIFEIDDVNELIVMEFVDGTNLKDRRDAGTFTKKQLIDIVIGISEALVEAHGKHVLHRDLTLANVMIYGTQLRCSETETLTLLKANL